jgi:hypothetical protein
MRTVALTGISDKVLLDLRTNRLRTLEIRSPHNFLSILDVKAGDTVFLTPTSTEDVKPGTIGIVTRIRGRQIATHRMVQKTEELYEEREVQTARVQLEMRGLGRVRRVEGCALGEATVVEVDEVTYFEAR